MVRQAWRFFWRTFFGNDDKIGICLLPFRYRRTLWYILRHEGLLGVWRFLQVKLFARGERVGLQLLDPLSQLGHTPYPRMIEIEVTTRCHLRCPLCERTYFPSDYSRQDLSYEQFLHIMKQFPKLRYINLTGEGSSFLNRDFPRMLEYCQNHGIYMTVIDSFSALTEEQMRMLIERGVKKIPISFDGATKEIYERVRVGASFDRTVANIRRFVELRKEYGSPIPELAFRFIFFRDNWEDVEKYPDLVNELRARNGDGIDNLIEYAALLEFEQTKDWVVELPDDVIERTERKLHAYGLPHAWSHPSHLPEQKRPMHECCAYAEPYIMSGGFVQPCCSVMMSNRRGHLQEHAFGSIYEQDFPTIWNGYREFRRQVPRKTGPVPVQCVGCRAFDTSRRQLGGT